MICKFWIKKSRIKVKIVQWSPYIIQDGSSDPGAPARFRTFFFFFFVNSNLQSCTGCAAHEEEKLYNSMCVLHTVYSTPVLYSSMVCVCVLRLSIWEIFLCWRKKEEKKVERESGFSEVSWLLKARRGISLVLVQMKTVSHWESQSTV